MLGDSSLLPMSQTLSLCISIKDGSFWTSVRVVGEPCNFFIWVATSLDLESVLSSSSSELKVTIRGSCSTGFDFARDDFFKDSDVFADAGDFTFAGRNNQVLPYIFSVMSFANVFFAFFGAKCIMNVFCLLPGIEIFSSRHVLPFIWFHIHFGLWKFWKGASTAY